MNVQFESGYTHRVEVSYPCLPPTCDNCKAVEHNICRCFTAPIPCSFCNSSARRRKGRMNKSESPKSVQKLQPSIIQWILIRRKGNKQRLLLIRRRLDFLEGKKVSRSIQHSPSSTALKKRFLLNSTLRLALSLHLQEKMITQFQILCLSMLSRRNEKKQRRNNQKSS